MRRIEWGTIGIIVLWIIVILIVSRLEDAHAMDIIYPPPAQLTPVLADFSALIKQPVSVYDIGLYRIIPTIFQSTALGCPKPNTDYGARTIKGYIVTFNYRGLGVEYREDSAGRIVLCSLGLAK